ncbi:MAG: hypothetical protein KA791_11385 [Flavobacteriales bacterium]|nr:hypothetical protein [Flavobacteriales bacterium]
MLLSLVLGSAAQAQNLVPNGSFEQYIYCPDDISQFYDNIVGWSVVSASPDYFNECRDSFDLGVPSNWLGYQAAAGGSGYAGLVTFNGDVPFYRELIEAELTNSLEIGVPVQLSIQVALGGFGSDHDYTTKWTTRGIGLRLSTQPFPWPQSSYPNSAHLYFDEVLTDTMEWHELTSTYIPDSAYRFITIGNFFEDSLSAPVLIDSTAEVDAAYVFVDEVCVSTASNGCNIHNGMDQSIGLTAWHVVSPFSDRLDVVINAAQLRSGTLSLWDAGGRLVRSIDFHGGDKRISLTTTDFQDGLYVLSLFDTMGWHNAIRIMHVSP